MQPELILTSFKQNISKNLYSLPSSNIMNMETRLLAYQLKKERAESTIKCTRNASGQLKYDTRPHFLISQLYASENPSATDIHRFLEKVSLPSISEDEKEWLSAPVTPEEVLQAIKSMPSGKTPHHFTQCHYFQLTLRYYPN